MAIDIKRNRVDFHCRTCLKEINEEKYKLNELPDPLYQLLLQCIGADCKQSSHPDSICVQCCDTIKNFEELKRKSKESNSILQELLEINKYSAIDENETINTSLYANERLNDPLNTNLEIKEEPKEETSKEEPSIVEYFSSIENEVITAEPDVVFFSTPEHAEEIICKYGCGKTFRCISSLKTHHKKQHSEQIKNDGASSSKKRKVDSDSETNNSASDDEEWQVPVSEKKYTCNVCNRKYVDRSTLNTHQRLHLIKRPFQCEKCPRAFNKKIRLTKHMREMHSSTPLELKCKYDCGKVFNRYHALDDHHYKHRNNLLDSFGNIIKPNNEDCDPKGQRKEITLPDAYVCEDCGKVFPNMTKFREHSYKHRPPEDQPYKCDQCQKTFIAKRSYDEHLLRHAGIKNFSCEICGLKTATQREVIKHKSIHTKDQQVTCTLCSKLYSNAKSLKRHIETVHQMLKKYNCRYCGEAFAKCDVRNRHEMEHGAERPYKCKLCNEGFFLISKLSSHTSSVHNAIT